VSPAGRFTNSEFSVRASRATIPAVAASVATIFENFVARFGCRGFNFYLCNYYLRIESEVDES